MPRRIYLNAGTKFMNQKMVKTLLEYNNDRTLLIFTSISYELKTDIDFQILKKLSSFSKSLTLRFRDEIKTKKT